MRKSLSRFGKINRARGRSSTGTLLTCADQHVIGVAKSQTSLILYKSLSIILHSYSKRGKRVDSSQFESGYEAHYCTQVYRQQLLCPGHLCGHRK
jgi:hypothetical protein